MQFSDLAEVYQPKNENLSPEKEKDDATPISDEQVKRLKSIQQSYLDRHKIIAELSYLQMRGYHNKGRSSAVSISSTDKTRK